jgi:hypothetical protein
MLRDLQRHVRLLLNQEDAGAVAIGLGSDEVSGGGAATTYSARLCRGSSAGGRQSPWSHNRCIFTIAPY